MKSAVKYQDQTPKYQAVRAEVSTFRNYIIQDESWRYLTRADDPSKKISPLAQNLLCTLVKKLRIKHELILSHDELSKITYRSARQNSRLLEQLANIFDIDYHRDLRVHGKRHERVLVIKYSAQGEKILLEGKGEGYSAEVIHISPRKGKKSITYSTKMSSTYIDNRNKLSNESLAKLDKAIDEPQKVITKPANVIDFSKYKKNQEPINIKNYLTDEKCYELNHKANRKFTGASTRGLMRRIESYRRKKGASEFRFFNPQKLDEYVVRCLRSEVVRESRQWLLSGYNHEEHCRARERGERFILEPDKQLKVANTQTYNHHSENGVSYLLSAAELAERGLRCNSITDVLAGLLKPK
jgi:hypothetical protein